MHKTQRFWQTDELMLIVAPFILKFKRSCNILNHTIFKFFDFCLIFYFILFYLILQQWRSHVSYKTEYPQKFSLGCPTSQNFGLPYCDL